MSDVAAELAPSVDGDRPWRVAGVIENLDLAGSDDEELEVAIPDRDEDLSIAIRPGGGGGTAAELVNLGVVEGGNATE